MMKGVSWANGTTARNQLSIYFQFRWPPARFMPLSVWSIRCFIFELILWIEGLGNSLSWLILKRIGMPSELNSSKIPVGWKSWDDENLERMMSTATKEEQLCSPQQYKWPRWHDGVMWSAHYIPRRQLFVRKFWRIDHPGLTHLAVLWPFQHCCRNVLCTLWHDVGGGDETWVLFVSKISKMWLST